MPINLECVFIHVRAQSTNLDRHTKRLIEDELRHYMGANPPLTWLTTGPNKRPMWAVAKVVVGVLILLTFSSGVIPAAHASMSRPGQWLYPVKQLIEESQLYFTVDPEAKARLKYAFALRRLQEWEESVALAEDSAYQLLAMETALASIDQLLQADQLSVPELNGLKHRLKPYPQLGMVPEIDQLLNNADQIPQEMITQQLEEDWVAETPDQSTDPPSFVLTPTVQGSSTSSQDSQMVSQTTSTVEVTTGSQSTTAEQSVRVEHHTSNHISVGSQDHRVLVETDTHVPVDESTSQLAPQISIPVVPQPPPLDPLIIDLEIPSLAD